jgi:hypothetical protein
MRQRTNASVRWLFTGLVLAAALTALGRLRERRATERLVDRLLASRPETSEQESETDALADLPTPVQQYLETALGDDPGRTRSVRVGQAGTLRVGGLDSPWRPFTATHHARVQAPGFVWDAVVDVFPYLSVGVRDAFVDEAGSSHVSLFGALPVGGAESTPELDEAALQRYLAEAVWYPTALCPASGVSWEAVDGRTARATLTCGETTASLTFHFTSIGGEDGHGDDDRVVVERVHTARRYRAVGDGFEPTPWTGLWRNYEERDGVLVPTTGEVVWHLPDGDLHAWRGTVERFSRR